MPSQTNTPGLVIVPFQRLLFFFKGHRLQKCVIGRTKGYWAEMGLRGLKWRTTSKLQTTDEHLEQST